MTRKLWAASLALLPALAVAQQPAPGGGKAQYISDSISVAIRESPRNDAGSVGTVSSGARVYVLESLGAESFTRIRTVDGRTGWITSRFVSDKPAAQDRLEATEKQLGEARARIDSLQKELDSAKSQLDKAKPAFELAGDNERLRAELTEKEQATQDMRSRYDDEKARRRTLVTGAALVGGGVVLGLVLPLLGRGKRRRYSDF